MRTRTFILFATMALFAACSAPGDQVLSAEQKTALAADSTTKAQTHAQEAAVRSLYDMFNTGKLDNIEAFCAPDFHSHQMDPSVTTTGLQSVRDMLNMYRTALPDFHQEILGISTTGDRTYLHLHITGTNSGPWPSGPATGKGIDVQGVDIVRFENGKAVEHWGFMEEMKMMQQLGLMPAPADAAKN